MELIRLTYLVIADAMSKIIIFIEISLCSEQYASENLQRKTCLGQEATTRFYKFPTGIQSLAKYFP